MTGDQSNRSNFLKNNTSTNQDQTMTNKEAKHINKANQEALEKIGVNINEGIVKSFKTISEDITKAMKELIQVNIKPQEVVMDPNNKTDTIIDDLIKKINGLEQREKQTKETINNLNKELTRHLKECTAPSGGKIREHFPSILNKDNISDKHYQPAILINSKIETIDGIEHIRQPLDYAKVASAKTLKPPRPTLSDSMETKITEALEKEPLKTEANINEETITALEKRERISKLFEESKKYIGISPIKPTDIESTLKAMDKKGYFGKNDDYQAKKTRTIKSMIKSWSKRYLKITDEEWNEIGVVEIKQVSQTSNIIFIKCETSEDIAKITAKAINLPSDNQPDSPRLVTYVPKQFEQRYKGYQTIAKHLRLTSAEPIKTNIRNGRFDYLLRIQPKTSNVPWSKVAPVIINQDIPDFNVGIIKVQEASIDFIDDITNSILENYHDILESNKRKAEKSENSAKESDKPKDKALRKIEPAKVKPILSSTPLQSLQASMEESINQEPNESKHNSSSLELDSLNRNKHE